MIDRAKTRAFARRLEPFTGAFFWLQAFYFVYLLRPEDKVPGMSYVPWAKVAGLFGIVGLLQSVGKSRLPWPREVIYLILLTVHFSVGVPFAYWRGGAFERLLDFSKVTVLVVLMLYAINNLARLRRVIYLHAACVACVASLSAIQGQRDDTGRLLGAVGGLYANPNDLGIAIVLCLPLCFAFFLRTKSLLRKAIWTSAMSLMVLALCLSASRSGLLSFVVVGAVCLLEFGVRGGRRYLIPIVGVAALAFFLLFGGKVTQRFEAMTGTNEDSTLETKAYGSAQERVGLLKKSLVLTIQHPIFGVGFGNFPALSGNFKVTHNSYTEISSEGGIPALVLFLLILWRAFANLREARRLVGSQSEEMLYVGALNAAFCGYIIGSCFISFAYDLFIYMFVGYTTALARIARSEATPSLEPVAAEGKMNFTLGLRGRTQGATDLRPAS